MPSKSPPPTQAVETRLRTLGEQIRARRQALRVSATRAAEAAGMSRITLHRIERGEPSVTIGAYLNALAALGLDIGPARPAGAPDEPDAPGEERAGWIPARIRLADYPQLRRLAWQIHGTDALTPAEALGFYERNARHFDEAALEARERRLIDALRLALGPRHDDV